MLYVADFFNIATAIQTIPLTFDNTITMLIMINTSDSNQWKYKTYKQYDKYTHSLTTLQVFSLEGDVLNIPYKFLKPWPEGTNDTRSINWYNCCFHYQPIWL